MRGGSPPPLLDGSTLPGTRLVQSCCAARSRMSASIRCSNSDARNRNAATSSRSDGDGVSCLAIRRACASNALRKSRSASLHSWKALDAGMRTFESAFRPQGQPGHEGGCRGIVADSTSRRLGPGANVHRLRCAVRGQAKSPPKAGSSSMAPCASVLGAGSAVVCGECPWSKRRAGARLCASPGSETAARSTIRRCSCPAVGVAAACRAACVPAARHADISMQGAARLLRCVSSAEL